MSNGFVDKILEIPDEIQIILQDIGESFSDLRMAHYYENDSYKGDTLHESIRKQLIEKYSALLDIIFTDQSLIILENEEIEND